MTIRVVLADGQGIEFDPTPGRVMLARSDHTFAELADAIDTAFGRWDPSPSHEFEVEGRLVASDPTAVPVLMPDAAPEDSDARALEDVGLRPGSRFTYLFDPSQRWVHRCRVEQSGLDPFTLIEEEPDVPVPVFGWGDVPDQYGRIDEDDEPYLPDDALAEVLEEALSEDDDLEVVLDLDEAGRDDDDEDEDDDDDAVRWQAPEPSSWDVVAQALEGLKVPRPDEELREAVDRLHLHSDDEDWPWGVLWAAGGLEDDELPSDDEELWLELASGVVVPREALPLEPEVEEAWAALEPADWAGAVIGLARGGAGQDASPGALLALIGDCAEVEASDLDEDEEAALAAGFETVVALWRALGAVDDKGRLTALGHWGLPRALERAWT
ncbi:MAG TPA: hypothetical protein VNU01_07095 [Egibacteraceae bacterium]|nr:hypothetical protein [Egibacteraceae bacterium]